MISFQLCLLRRNTQQGQVSWEILASVDMHSSRGRGQTEVPSGGKMKRAKTLLLGRPNHQPLPNSMESHSDEMGRAVVMLLRSPLTFDLGNGRAPMGLVPKWIVFSEVFGLSSSIQRYKKVISFFFLFGYKFSMRLFANDVYDIFQGFFTQSFLQHQMRLWSK